MFSFLQTGYANNIKNLNVACDQRLQNCLSKVLKLSSARELIAEIQQQGPIQIRVVRHPLSQQFGAYWDREGRVIGIQLSSQKLDEGKVIGSIIFELQNALANRDFDRLDALASSGRLGKEKYVEAMEHLEYQNSKKASALVQEGISQGLFPATAYLPTYSCFEEHFYYQKISGHSNAFRQAYDALGR